MGNLGNIHPSVPRSCAISRYPGRPHRRKEARRCSYILVPSPPERLKRPHSRLGPAALRPTGGAAGGGTGGTSGRGGRGTEIAGRRGAALEPEGGEELLYFPAPAAGTTLGRIGHAAGEIFEGLATITALVLVEGHDHHLPFDFILISRTSRDNDPFRDSLPFRQTVHDIVQHERSRSA